MEEIERKISELVERNKELEKENKEQREIIKRCRSKMVEQSDTIRSLNRTITLQRSELKRKGR